MCPVPRHAGAATETGEVVSVEIPFLINGNRAATIGVTRVETGCDGTHTYEWEWGINDDTGYTQIDNGKLQHREADGLFALTHKILHNVLAQKRTH